MADIRHLGIPEPESFARPQTPDEIIAAQLEYIALLEAENLKLRARFNDKRWMIARALALLNGKRGLGFAFLAGAVAATLLAGGGFGIKAVYDASHRQAPHATGSSRVELQPVLIPPNFGTSSPSPSPSPSVPLIPAPARIPVAVVVPRPSSSPSPSDSPDTPRKHCPTPPPVSLPRCPSPSPLPPV